MNSEQDDPYCVELPVNVSAHRFYAKNAPRSPKGNSGDLETKAVFEYNSTIRTPIARRLSPIAANPITHVAIHCPWLSLFVACAGIPHHYAEISRARAVEQSARVL